MILNFSGGARPNERTRYGKQKINTVGQCSVICLDAEDSASAFIAAGTPVQRGSLLGKNKDMPVYASIGGVFRGFTNIEGKKYFVVMSNGNTDNTEKRIHSPEKRALTELTKADIIESAKKFAIVDVRSGIPLWKLLESAGDTCRRLVIDCTETDAACAINFRLCIEKARSLVGGAKVLLQAIGALKCVFAAEYYRNAAFSAISKYATDEKLFAFAPLEEKYPYSDISLMDALYVKTLSPNQTALDMGVLIVAPETAIALFDAMISGMPQLDKYIAVCFKNSAKGGNLRVPRGITIHDISESCGKTEEGCFFVENSLLSGRPISGVLSDRTSALIEAKVEKKVQKPCISCGRCAEACPVRLMPNEILSGGFADLAERCISCGACEFVCPSNIPLVSLIQTPNEEKGA